MSVYVVESYDYSILHAGSYSDGVVGQGGGSEKIYLHAIAIDDGDIAKLKARVDENGNKEHDRLALPRSEEWWLAVDGDKAWPKTTRPKVVSRCTLDDAGVPRPRPLDDDELAALRKLGVSL